MTINIYVLRLLSDMILTSGILDRIICQVVGVDDDLNDEVQKYIIHLIRGWS
jgi:hypothetical protein